jgi:DNA-binding NtrC family response regulator
VKEGTFREDLYYRLNVVTVNLPPLRQRTDDIPLLVEHFLREIATTKHTATHRISPEVMRAFQAYPWPGNVRELRNILESMMVLADGEVLTELDLPDTIRAGAPRQDGGTEIPDLTIEELERLAIFRALEKCAGNRTHAAVRLGISVRTLQRKLKEYEDKGLIASADSDVLTRT